MTQLGFSKHDQERMLELMMRDDLSPEESEEAVRLINASPMKDSDKGFCILRLPHWL